MPYVKADAKLCVDGAINDLLGQVEDYAALNGRDKLKGLMNYIITRLAVDGLKPDGGWNYAALCDVMGTLECAKAEVYRRLVAPYENMVIQKNGDIDCYK